jgi:hypothetical protein
MDKYRREVPKTQRWMPGTPDPKTITEHRYSIALPEETS